MDAIDTPTRREGEDLFERAIEAATRTTGLHARGIDTIQLNIGLRCDLSCAHCHVAASPQRREEMSPETMELVLAAVRACGARTVDITGGAPELHPRFRDFVRALAREEVEVLVRTNLTVFFEPEAAGIAAFFRDHRVHLVASLPCYLEDNVDTQRGDGVFRRSLDAIRELNELGYGRDDALLLDLVYNPVGHSLPPEPAVLETAYKQHLADDHGIVFSRLLTITNMPIGRFRADLKRSGDHDRYRDVLRESFNPRTIDSLMCRRQISVRWDGTLFDCDFNLALKMPVDGGSPTHIRDFEPQALGRRRIATAEHCFGCTAGRGSSCGGALDVE